MLRLALAIAAISTLLPCFGQGSFKVKAGYLSTLNLHGKTSALDREYCELFIEGYRSLFIYQQPAADSSGRKTEVSSDEFGTPSIAIQISSRDSINKRYYIDHHRQELVSREFVFENGRGNPYIVAEALKRIPWVLSNEFKTIGNFRCQKASGRFRGRTYTAWFTAQVPVNGGPWKLHGLPGLILEAYDDNRVVHFICRSLEFPYKGSLKIEPPTEGEAVSLEEYIDAREKTVHNVKNYLLSKLPRGANLEINSVENNDLEREFDFGNQ